MNTLERKNYLKDKLKHTGCSQEELSELYFLIQKHGSDSEWEALLKAEWESQPLHELSDQEAQNMLRRLKRKINSPNGKQVWWKNFNKVSRVAASVLILMSLISAFFFHQLNKKPEASVDNIKWITKATPNGQRSVVRLKDGSVVTLNAGSSITYPEFFDNAKRQIKLKGEAFFEVSKNAAWPFEVESQGVLTTVLGTSFNIKAFDNQNTQVTVATGKVKVASTNNKVPQEAILRPNQQANFRLEDELMEVKEVDIDNYLAWKTNGLYFDMIPFSEVLEVLEKKYNVHIAMTNDLSSKCLVRARYKNESLETVLKGLQLLVHFNFKIHDGNKITVEGMGCED